MTKNQTKKINILNILYIMLLLAMILVLAIIPATATSAFLDGVRIWATKVMPALLPFFVLSRLLSYTDFIPALSTKLTPLTKRLYNVGGVSGYIYLMSIISGYPVGAFLTSDLYKSNKITRGQAITITSFASTSGPLFILGTVAQGMYNSSIIGVIILLSHILGAMLNGLFYRAKESQNDQAFEPTIPTNLLGTSMTSSITSILSVGGFIALFYMILVVIIQLNILTPIVNLFGLIGVNSDVCSSIICGFVEVTTGCLFLSKCNLGAVLLTTISTFLISFGGLSIHAQAFCYLRDFDMPYSKFLLMKITHAVISSIIALIVAICVF